MEQWIGSILTILGFLITAAVLWGKFSTRVDNVEKLQDKQNRYHADHFDKIGKLETSTATMVQELKDHKQVDDERFGRIEEMSKEIRGDIKELLKRSSGDLRP